jgi:WD40 repeat protein/tRNA A-37 threonylcarbamoyl transferase component Bud32
MPTTRACKQGHLWQTGETPEPANGTSVCPVCGGADETWPTGPDSATDDQPPIPIPVAVPNPAAAALSHFPGDLAPNLPGYEILGTLGQGGMGVVYKARQLRLKRIVAIKFIRANARTDTPTLRRFQSEAEAVAKLRHPNIVQLYELGEHRGVPYLTLEYVEGGTLAQKLGEHPFTVPDAAALLLSLASATQAAHAAGVIHRDLKPANILLSGDRGQETGDRKAEPSTLSALTPVSCPLTPKISDFGLAKHTDSDDGQTRTGAILGTPNYMAPEQALGGGHLVTASVDLYALGAILYEMLVGKPPFHGATPLETLEQVRNRDPIPPRQFRPDVPRDLETICLKCLEKTPEKRYASAHALAEDLRRFLNGEPIVARPLGWLGGWARWANRHRALAALYVASAVFLAAIIAVLTVSGAEVRDKNRQLETKNDAYARQTDDLNHSNLQLKETVEKSELLRYLRSIPLAHRELQANNVRGAMKILDECPEHLRHWEWHLLRQFQPTPLQSFPVATTAVPKLHFAPAADRLIATDRVGKTHVWNVADGKATAGRFAALTHVIDLAFSKDGRHAAVLRGVNEFTGELHLWDLAADRPVTTVGGLEKAGILGLPTAVALAPDGQTFVVGSVRGTIGLGRFDAPGPPAAAKTTYAAITSLSFRPDGKQFLSSSILQSRVWTTFPGQWRELTDLGPLARFVPGRDDLAIGTSGSDLVIVPVASSEKRVTLRGHSTRIQALAVSADGQTAATADLDQSIIVWDLAAKTAIRTIREPGLNSLLSLAISPDGSRVASIAATGSAHIWDARNAPEETRLAWPRRLRTTAVPDRRLVVYSNNDRQFGVWDQQEGKDAFTRESALRYKAFAFNRDQSLLAVAAPTEADAKRSIFSQSIQVMAARSGEPVASFRAHQGHGIRLCFADHADQILSAGDDGQTILWDARRGEPVRRFSHGPSTATTAAISPDGRLVATATGDGRVTLFDAGTGDTRHTFAVAKTQPLSLCFQPRGDVLAAGYDDGTIRLWDTATGRAPVLLQGHSALVRGLAWTSDGKRLASHGMDGHVRIWEPRLGIEILKLGADVGSSTSLLDFGTGDRVLGVTGNTTTGKAVCWPATRTVAMPKLTPLTVVD